MVTLDEKSLRALIKRFDSAPKRIQSNALRATARAGANVVKKAAKAGAPAHLQKSVKVKARNTNGRKGRAKMSVVVGTGAEGFKVDALQDPSIPGGAEKLTPNDYPATWVEFGTYGNRDYQDTEPYSPETLRKKSYSSGKSDSVYWKAPFKWTPAKPFMRPAINDHVPAVEQAMGDKLDEYLKKKGL